MDLRLKDKKAIIFGGSRGIGLAVVEALIAEGAEVAFCARDQSRIASVVERLVGAGGKVRGDAVDCADGAAIDRWVSEVAADFGGIDVAMLCASALSTGATEEDWKRSIDVDLLGSVRTIQALRPHLEAAAERHGDAAIVHISTTAASEVVFTASYGAAKAAVAHYCKSMARELAPKKVRVNTVSPGMVYFEGGLWQMIEQKMPERFAMALSRNPMGRLGSDREIADAMLFLASPRSSFTTGANLIVDGALTQSVHY